MFDYGKEGNLKKYGMEKAPQYNLTNVSFGNVHLFVGKYDKLATVEDVRRLYKDLTNAGNKVLIVVYVDL
jgi:predicted esterase